MEPCPQTQNDILKGDAERHSEDTPFLRGYNLALLLPQLASDTALWALDVFVIFPEALLGPHCHLHLMMSIPQRIKITYSKLQS